MFTGRTANRVAFICAVVLALLGAARAGWCDEIDQLLRIVHRAGHVRLSHTRAVCTALPFNTSVPSRLVVADTVAPRTIQPEWSEQLIKALEVDSLLHAAADTCGIPETISAWSDSGESIVLEFNDRDAHASAVIGRDGWINLQADSLGFRSWVACPLGPRSGNFLALLKDVLPGDPWLARPPGEMSVLKRRACVGASPDSLPVAIFKLPPEYPGAARDAGISGTVQLRVRVGRTGRVDQVAVVHSVPELDAAAIQAVENWGFMPARYRGRSVSAVVQIPVKFTLH